MPIYEFYCSGCHTVFNFLSRKVNTSKRPDCPKCGEARLARKASSFAISKGRAETDGEDEGLPDLDEAKMEQAMASIAQEAEGMSEEDPRQMARLMRKLYDSTGLQLGEGIEEEMGDLMETEDPLAGGGGKKLSRALRRRLRPPSVDDTLYEL